MSENRFFVADTHFSDHELISLEGRPFKDVAEMDAALVANWNMVVKPGDQVYHVGDFGRAENPGASNLLAIIRSLNGNIHLVAGNHDKNNVWKHRKRFASWSDYKEVKCGGQWIILFHYPMRSWRGAHKGSWHLYGHVHGNMPPHFKSFDVGVKSNNWTPLSFEQVAARMAKLKGGALDVKGVE